MTDLRRLGVDGGLDDIATKLLPHFLHHLGLADASIERRSGVPTSVQSPE